jgi:hypothetical protein
MHRIALVFFSPLPLYMAHSSLLRRIRIGAVDRQIAQLLALIDFDINQASVSSDPSFSHAFKVMV